MAARRGIPFHALSCRQQSKAKLDLLPPMATFASKETRLGCSAAVEPHDVSGAQTADILGRSFPFPFAKEER